jgi:RHS repeat-associated protein
MFPPNSGQIYIWNDGISVPVVTTPGTVAAGTIVYYHTDAIGSVRMTTNDARQETRYDFAPFGEPVGATPAGEPRQFAGKERDNSTNTGFDYFGSRYYSNLFGGRFTTPDVSGADQHTEDPQSWNRYSYVRNNPLAHIDPSGRACVAINLGSDYCTRAVEYATLDSQLNGYTRFFAAASAVSQALADTDVWFLSRIIVSSSTQTFLSTLGKDLQKMNSALASSIRSGALRGDDLDARLVHLEQSQVQESLDSLKRSDPGKYNTVIAENNKLLNRGMSSSVLSAVSPATDVAYLKVLADVRKQLGRDIDFSRQTDREAIGNALIKHIRTPGGCDVIGETLGGC